MHKSKLDKTMLQLVCRSGSLAGEGQGLKTVAKGQKCWRVLYKHMGVVGDRCCVQVLDVVPSVQARPLTESSLDNPELSQRQIENLYTTFV